MKKKAMLLTLGLFLVVFELLALTVLIRNDYYDSSELFVDMYSYNTLNLQVSAVERSVFELVNSTVGVSKTGSDVTFLDTLPNTGVNQFVGNITSFETFLESNFDGFELELSDLELVPLKIKPNNVSYRHASNNTILVTPTETNFNKYTLHIQINENVSSCVWTTSSGDLDVELTVTGTFDTSCTDSDTVSTSSLNTININSGNYKVYVNNSRLEIVTNSGDISLNTTISLDTIENQRPTVWFLSNLTVNKPKFDLFYEDYLAILK